MRVGLVSCSGPKLKHAAPASELYTSPLFRKSYAHSQRTYDATYILSGRYGLLETDKVIEPYNSNLKGLLKKDLVRWGAYVAQQIRDKIDNESYLYFLAGRAYYASIVPYLRNPYQIPLKHMSFGPRMKWLEEH